MSVSVRSLTNVLLFGGWVSSSSIPSLSSVGYDNSLPPVDVPGLVNDCFPIGLRVYLKPLDALVWGDYGMGVSHDVVCVRGGHG